MQLWRVLERADVVVLVIDVRTPLTHLPPALYLHVSQRLRKTLVLVWSSRHLGHALICGYVCQVLSKVDLVERSVTTRWTDWLQQLPGVWKASFYDVAPG